MLSAAIAALGLISAHASPTLTVDELVHGHPVRVAVYGARPGARVAVLRSAAGPGPGHQLRPGLQLGLLPDVTVVLDGYADADGTVDWFVPSLDPRVPLTDLYVQAVVVAGPQSDVTNILHRAVFAEPPDWVDDALEDHDELGTAAELTTPVEARLCADDPDWYWMTVGPGEIVNVSVQAIDPLPTVALVPELHGRPAGVAGRRFSDGRHHGVSWMNTTDEAQTLQVELPATGLQPGLCEPYRIEQWMGVPTHTCIDDPGEPDDELVAAHRVWVGGVVPATSCPGDADWYRLVASEDGDLRLSVESTGGVVALEVAVDGLTLGMPADHHRVPVLQGDEVFVRAAMVDDDALESGVAYLLSTELADPCPSTLGSPQHPLALQLGRQTLEVCGDDAMAERVWLAVPTAPDTQVDVLIRKDGATVHGVLREDGRALTAADGQMQATERLTRWSALSSDYRPWSLGVQTAGEVRFDVEVRHSTATPCMSDRHEPNDIQPTLWDGSPLAATHCDADRYHLAVGAGETVEVSVDWDHAGVRRPLQVRHQDGVAHGDASVRLFSPVDQLVEVVLPAPPAARVDAGYRLSATVDPCGMAYEPDDVVWLATSIASGVPLEADSCGTDDWYSLAASFGELVDVEVDGCVVVTDAMGFALAQGCDRVSVMAPGALLVRVDGTEQSRPYTITATVRTHTCVADAPPGMLSLGERTAVLCPGEVDVFDLPLVAGELRTVAMRQLDDDLAQMRVFDPVGTPVTETTWRAAMSGVYRVEIRGLHDRGGDGIAYQLAVQGRGDCPIDAAEPNDLPGEASWVLPGGAVAESCPGDSDWWLVQAQAGWDASDIVQVDLRASRETGWSDGSVSVYIEDLAGHAIPRRVPTDGVYRVRVDVQQSTDETPGVLYRVSPGWLPPCSSDAHEPNDDVGTATTVQLPAVLDGATCRGDVDMYAVHVEAGRTLRVQVHADDPSVRVDVQFTDASGALLASGVGNTQWVASTTGTVFVAAESWRPTRYEITVDLDGCIDDGLEPNNVLSAATLLPWDTDLFATACPSDVDVYQLHLAGGDLVGLSIDGAQLLVSDASGVVLGQGETFDWYTPVPMTLFVRVEFSLSNGQGRSVDAGLAYILRADRGGECVPDAAEPNDVPAEATPVSDGVYGPYSVCTRAVGIQGGDWFRVDLLPGESVDAAITFDHMEGDVDLLMYDPYGALIDWSGSTADVEEVHGQVRRAGPLFLRVHLWADDGGGEVGNSYVLDVARHGPVP